MLPKILGKTFYKSNKKPIPVSLEPYRQTDSTGKRVTPKPAAGEKTKPIAPPLQVAKEIEKTLGCALVHLSPSNNVSVRIGFSSFTPQQIAENVEAVVKGLVEKFISKGWRNVRGVHIKAPKTMALPIWLASELWVEEKDVLEDEEAKDIKAVGGQRGMKRKGRELDKVDDGVEQKEEEDGGKMKSKKKRKVEDTDLSKEMKERRDKLREQKRLDREDIQRKAVEVVK